ncbi:MAG: DUF1553 domain-containing protein [Planctomycetales bacterium]|nr:DUF1553 domain-containing protein [Planctomycetales bacterium]
MTAPLFRMHRMLQRFRAHRSLGIVPASIASLCLLVGACSNAEPAEPIVAFNRDIRPILAEHCWSCHGPDANAREAGLRLDARDAALTELPSRHTVIRPGQPEQSELWRRVSSTDPNLQMPPPEFNKPLSASQRALLKRWIQAGAAYQRHWSFETLRRPAVPASEGGRNALDPIDAFVAERLRQSASGLEPAPPASPERWLRRVCFALTGLPPTAEQLEQLAGGPRAERQIVDQLLSSPHFGEQLAVEWLDAARYADTNGYFGDKPRQMWLWRDWVIQAWNQGMPFDRFTIEQLAGDLLPDATVQQRIATGFNRNHMANNETGIIDEEYRVEYVVDRINTTMTTWTALTVGCSQCHDHKYDPISQREYFQLFAFFNNGPERGLITADNPPPVLAAPTLRQQQELNRLRSEEQSAQAEWEQLRPALEQQIAAWMPTSATALPSLPAKPLLAHDSLDDATPSAAGIVAGAARFDGTQQSDRDWPELRSDAAWTIGLWIKPDGPLSCLLSKIEPAGRRRGFELLLQKGTLQVHLVEQWAARAIEVSASTPIRAKQWQHLVICYDGSRKAAGLRVLIDGAPAPLVVHRDTLRDSIANDEPWRIGRRDAGLGYEGLLDELRLLGRTVTNREAELWYRAERLAGLQNRTVHRASQGSPAMEARPTHRASQGSPAMEARPMLERDSADNEFLRDEFLRQHTSANALATPTATSIAQRAKLALEQLQRAQLATRRQQDRIPTTLVMEELPQRRETHVLARGRYDAPGEAVAPGTPASLPPMPASAPRNRLGLAQWLVSPDHPLTARVAANRLWRQCFGEGLVRSANDFGAQGELPSHPELLDWLACELVESQWDIKTVLRQIVLSRTFRQDSAVAASARLADPDNRLLSRGPDYRLSAEMVRDQALAVSGLLERRVGGPSVKPYQPPGLWKEVTYNADETYRQDHGEALWRRSLYTYVKRQAPPPAMQIFDAPTREQCVVQRPRTATPLQALVLLNDPTYLEAARILAHRAIGAAADDQQRVRCLFRQVVSRAPDAVENQILLSQLRRQRGRFTSADGARAAQRLLAVGEAARGQTQPAANEAELAAWTLVAQTVLTLDEALRVR